MNWSFPSRPLFVVPIARGGALHLGARPLVMGILNVTPDSFAEPESGLAPDAAVDRALRMEADGADIIDMGGESTRPGASPISAEDELARVLPVIHRAGERLRIPMSIDTYKAVVAREALDAGASIVNDVSGLRRDSDLASVVAARGAALILMHSRGTPQTMMEQAHYRDLVEDIVSELRQSIRVAAAAGVTDDRVILDPGVGFAKGATHSYGVLARFAEIGSALDRPLLVGPSRKSFMRGALDGRPAVERDWGTAAAVAAAVLGGAHILRVHAVAEMVQVVRVAESIREAGRREPSANR